MADKEDFTFMKSGFNNLDRKDDTVENVAAIVLNYMANALQSASVYIKHSKRNAITKEDIKRGFMLEVFFMNQRQDTLEKCHEMKQKINKIISDGEEMDSEEEIEYEEDEDAFTLSTCECAMCKCMNNIYERWEKWTPTTSIEKVLHKHIDNI